MKLNLHFVNTGLDDRIVKSMQDGTHPAKTMKQVFVHDKKKGDYYRMQPVNVQQPTQGHTPKGEGADTSSSNSHVDSDKRKLAMLLKKLKDSGADVKIKKLKVSEDNEIFLYKDLQRRSWNDIKKLTETPAYYGYTVLKGEQGANYALGSENWRDYVGKQPGATSFDNYYKSMDSFEEIAVSGYTYSKWTHPMTNYLRKLEGEGIQLPEGQDEIDIVKTIALNLDSAIEKYDLEKPMVVYRSVRMSALTNLLARGDGIIKDDSHTSTTVIKEGFDLGNEPTIMMVIKVPAGKGHGAWLKPISQVPSENEFLLARGTMFKVTSLDITYDKNLNPANAVVEMEIIGHMPEPLEPPKTKIDYLDFVDICEEVNEDDPNYYDDDDEDWA